jgi:hypothetical protein
MTDVSQLERSLLQTKALIAKGNTTLQIKICSHKLKLILAKLQNRCKLQSCTLNGLLKFSAEIDVSTANIMPSP